MKRHFFKRTPAQSRCERLRHYCETGQLPHSVYLGNRCGRNQHPVILDDRFLENHLHVMGGSGSGKSACLVLLASQFIQRQPPHDIPIVVLDHKGDDGLLQQVLDQCSMAGKLCKYFTTANYLPTYLYNPLLQKNYQSLTSSQFAHVNLVYLRLKLGLGWSQQYFEGQGRKALELAINQPIEADDPFAAFRDEQPQDIHAPHNIVNYEELLRRVQRIGSKDTDGLANKISQMANIAAINYPGGTKFNIPNEAIQAAIHLPDILQRDENGRFRIYYFYLQALIDDVGLISNSVLYGIFHACVTRLHASKMGYAEPPPNVLIINDEMQVCADPESYALILEQSRSAGIRLVFAHQDISQLRRVNPHFATTVLTNCRNRIWFGANDMDARTILKQTSGSQRVWDRVHSWGPNGYTFTLTPKQQEIINDNLIAAVNATPGCAICHFARNVGVLQYDNIPIVVRTPFLYSAKRFRYLSDRPWPAPTKETVRVHDYLHPDHDLFDYFN